MRKVNARDWKTGELIHENVTFHQFGLELVEYDTGGQSCSVAILELHDGTVTTWSPNHIQFIEPASSES
ncbi:MAG: hypothetical protein HRU77_01685 [Gammaproteobacteria bacterium]|nr:MAG: hypothetical protein HRU77_01685 [Gammaproteobacteria bacterium]